MSKHRCLMVGAGGMARSWIRRFFPNFSERTEIVGLVDIDAGVLEEQGDFLGLANGARFRDVEQAFESVDADYCTIVVPPEHHRQVAVGAAARGLDILSEKPIADTWEDTLAIYRASSDAGIKMQVVQNYRQTPRILALKKAIADGRIGRPNYVIVRFAADYRVRDSWGKFRHEIPHSLLVEGSVHHFDQVRHVTEADCATIAGHDWNPGHESFDGECCASFVVRMSDGVYGSYEGSCLGAGAQNSWYREFYRVEGDEGSVVVDADDKVLLLTHTPGAGATTEELPHVALRWEAHNAMIDQFLGWLDGGDEPPTVIHDNIKSAAMLFAAIEASELSRSVDVADRLEQAVGTAAKKAG